MGGMGGSAGAFSKPRLTRDCLDPWNNIEVSSQGDVRPCCNFNKFIQLSKSLDFDVIRNGESFRALRASLLDGNLQGPCQACHIRKKVPTEALRERLERLSGKIETAQLLDPLPLDDLRIDINEKCNLRCDYCAVSSPTYHGSEMQEGTYRHARLLLNHANSKTRVHVNGHGETTFHPRWLEWCRSITDTGHRVCIITNLAKNFSDAEIDLLSRFYIIQISLDSDDPELMKRIRKAVRVDHVFATLGRIRDRAAALTTQSTPIISFSIGVYDPAIWTLERFLDRAITCGVRNFVFWNLVEMEHQTLVRSLRRLTGFKRARARKILERVRRKLVARFNQFERNW